VEGYYPIVLDLSGRSCLVIGGGRVAEGKVAGLLAVGAAVTVLSPTLTAPLDSWAREGRIRHLAREYRAGDLTGHQLVFATTGRREVAEAVAREGRELGIWVNAADDPRRCDFILPSILRRGRLLVAVSTGGASPALARAIREELEVHFTGDYATLAEIAAEVRGELRELGAAPGSEAWRRAFDAELRGLIADGKREEAKARLRGCLGGRLSA
jgi:precorrin-2 dehydrogenase/sirohydrochlorin ferrochelatase